MDGVKKAGVVLRFPVQLSPLQKRAPLVVPEDLRRRVSAVARRMRWSEEDVLRCMLEEAILLATRRA